MDPVATLAIPSSYLALHKLKQWDECQIRALNTPGSNDQSAHLTRARKQLFSILSSLRHSIPKFRHDPTYDPDLHNESAPRVNHFLAAHGCYAREWRKMGFRPDEGSSQPRRRRGFSVMQIRSLAAHTTVSILAELGLPCAIFGSMACKLYGNERIPDVRSFFFRQSSYLSLVIGCRHSCSSTFRTCFNYTGRD
jgi:hypothetical protein